jgi:hypothetical protein
MRHFIYSLLVTLTGRRGYVLLSYTAGFAAPVHAIVNSYSRTLQMAFDESPHSSVVLDGILLGVDVS